MPGVHDIGALEEATDLFSAFWTAAHWVWQRRQTAKNFGFPFSEETVTETILLDIATRNPASIKIIPLNKHQEGKVGADWEWCFYNKAQTKFTRTLVQAKVLDDHDNEYSHIDRKIGNSSVRQIDRLIASAEQRGIPALYVFYNNLTTVSRVPAERCSCFNCAECWGCSAADAYAIRALLPDKTFDTLRDVCFPWLCLLCARETAGDADRDLPDRVSKALLQLEVLSTERVPALRDTASRPPFPQRVWKEPPPYFERSQAIGTDTSPQLQEMLVRTLQSENPDLDGIVLATEVEPEEEDAEQ